MDKFERMRELVMVLMSAARKGKKTTDIFDIIDNMESWENFVPDGKFSDEECDIWTKLKPFIS